MRETLLKEGRPSLLSAPSFRLCLLSAVCWSPIECAYCLLEPWNLDLFGVRLCSYLGALSTLIRGL